MCDIPVSVVDGLSPLSTECQAEVDRRINDKDKTPKPPKPTLMVVAPCLSDTV